MKKHEPAFLLFLLLLHPPGLHAQKVEGWLHPELSSSTYLTGSYMPDSGEGRLSALSALSATFGRGSALEASLSFDVIQKKLMGYELAWHPVPALRFRAGIQRMPFLLETTYSPRVMEAIGYSQAASYLGGYSRDLTGINSRSRDCGVAVEGSFWPKDGGFNLLSVVAGVFIGNGYSFRDDNRAKDFQGRVVLQPDRRWKLSAGTLIGRYSAEMLVRNRLTTGFWYDDGQWFIRGENIYGNTGGMLSDGFFVMGGCWFKPTMALSARCDRFQTDLSDSDTVTTAAQVCFSQMLSADRNFSYRLQYGHTFYSDPSAVGSNTLSCCLIFRFGARL